MKELLTEIKYMMYEEMGISDVVTRETKYIIDRIIKDSKQYPYNTVKHGKFDFITFNNITIHIIYNLYYVTKEEELNIIHTGYSERINDKEYNLSTTIVYITSLNKYFDYKGTTQHEMDHIYKMIQSGKHLLNKPVSQNLYNKASSFKTSNDYPHQLIGYVLYYNNNFEKDAFINSLYKTIMNHNDIDPYSTIQNSLTYKNIHIIKNDIIDSSKYQNQISDICEKELNKSYKWFYNLTEKMIDSYIYKMGRLLTKVYKDLNIKRLDDIWPNDLSQSNI